MKALIFNSGVGTRLGELTKTSPKCMTYLDESNTILKLQLESLALLDVEEVIITTGPFEEMLKDYVASLPQKPPVRFVQNPLYTETNYIYSMYCARDFIKDDNVIVLHGDLVFDISVLRDLMAVDTHSVAAIDFQSPLPEKDFKAKIENGKIQSISVDLSGRDCYACQPLYMFLQRDFSVWLSRVCDFCENGNVKVYAENALNEISNQIDFRALDLKSRLCKEIDNMEDLESVSAIFRGEK